MDRRVGDPDRILKLPPVTSCPIWPGEGLSMGALVLLARSALVRAGAIRAGAGRLAVPIAGGAAGVGLGGLAFGGDDRPRRRRRKRVFTANDRADISFISATLGAPAGKQVAMIIAARA